MVDSWSSIWGPELIFLTLPNRWSRRRLLIGGK
jgi:hypothetical protein